MCVLSYNRKIVAEYEKTIAQMIGELKCQKIQSTKTFELCGQGHTTDLCKDFNATNLFLNVSLFMW